MEFMSQVLPPLPRTSHKLCRPATTEIRRPKTAMRDLFSLRSRADSLTTDTAAQIPYLLVKTSKKLLHLQLPQGNTAVSNLIPGKSLRELLLPHPLYVVSTFLIISIEIKTCFRRCLVWIGANMGIGQAFQLAKARALQLTFSGSSRLSPLRISR